MTPRDEHLEAVHACWAKAREIRAMIGALSDETRALLGMVEKATGGAKCQTEAGRVAFESARFLEVAVTNEPNRLVEVVDAELLRYGNGF